MKLVMRVKSVAGSELRFPSLLCSSRKATSTIERVFECTRISSHCIARTNKYQEKCQRYNKFNRVKKAIMREWDEQGLSGRTKKYYDQDENAEEVKEKPEKQMTRIERYDQRV